MFSSVTSNPTVVDFCKDVREGAIKGATYGAGAGIALNATTIGMAISFKGLETLQRASGGEPKWPMFDGDCELTVFKDLPQCNGTAYEMGMIFIFSMATLTGSAIGAAYGGLANIVKHVKQQ